jgi:hypothetical protein
MTPDGLPDLARSFDRRIVRDPMARIPPGQKPDQETGGEGEEGEEKKWHEEGDD